MPDFGFPPIAHASARILVLGSMPGQKSLAAQEYYAHPQNAFWPIMAELVSASGDYGERCNALTLGGIALWDVLRSSSRPGSMDADIRLDESEANDFNAFFTSHPEIDRIGFNGQTAARLFLRLVQPQLGDRIFQTVTLPSTSPAYAAMPYAAKLERWREFITTT